MDASVVKLRTDAGSIQTVELANLVHIRFHVGGDWVCTNGHRGAVRDKKFNVRCFSSEKKFIQDAAKVMGMAPSAFIMKAALSLAQKTLKRPQPGP